MKHRDPDRPKVPDLVPLIRAVYARENGGAGCCLHVVTDDGNYGSVEFAASYARENGHPECIAAALMMSMMTYSQIKRATERALSSEAPPLLWRRVFVDRATLAAEYAPQPSAVRVDRVPFAFDDAPKVKP